MWFLMPGLADVVYPLQDLPLCAFLSGGCESGNNNELKLPLHKKKSPFSNLKGLVIIFLNTLEQQNQKRNSVVFYI